MIDLGLKRVRRLLSLIGNPQSAWKAVHVAGTNGKGSVCAYVSSVATVSKLQTGRFTSPHLIKRWDCISINGKSVDEMDFLNAELHVKQINDTNGVEATEFELLTVIAFELFKRQNVQLAVIEVGLGGALDATNVLQSDSVLCSIITKIGLDHQGFLGNTLAEIATQKAGIMKANVPCVVDSTNDPHALEAIQIVAKKNETQLIMATPVTNVKSISPLQGDFQAANLSCALEALKVMSAHFPQISPETIELGIKSTSWPGRLQWLNKSTLLDGAHNEDAAERLAEYINSEVRPTVSDENPLTFIMAFSKGKDIAQILKCLLRPGDMLIATQFGPVDGMPWVEACDAEHIAGKAKELEVCQNISTNKSLHNVVKQLPSITGTKIVCGSLYLVGQLLALNNDK